MNASLGDLVVSLSANIARFEEAMTRAEYKSQITADKIAGSMATAERAVAGLAAGFASFKTVEMFASSIDGAIEASAQLNKMAEQAGTTAAQLSGLRAVARLSATDMDSVTRTLQLLSKNMYETAQGTGKAINTFAGLDLSVRGTGKTLKDNADFLLEIATRLENMDDKTQRVAAAIKLLGRGGAEMLPFLHDLATQGAINATVTNEQAKMAEVYERSLIKLKIAHLGIYNTIAQQVLPVLQTFANMMLDVQNGADGLGAKTKELAQQNAIRQWAIDAGIGIAMVVDGFRYVALGIEIAGKVIVALGFIFIGVLQTIGDAIGAASASLNSFRLIIEGIGLIVSGNLSAGIASVKQGWDELKNGFSGFWTDVKQRMTNVGETVTVLTDDIDTMLGSFQEGKAVNAFLDALSKVQTKFKETSNAVSDNGNVIAKYKRDAIDGLTNSLIVEAAKLEANIKWMQMYGVETKATNVVATAAKLVEMELTGQLQEHAAKTGKSVEAIKQRTMALAEQLDKDQEIYAFEKQRIAGYDKEVEALQKLSEQTTNIRQQAETYGFTAEQVTRYNMAILQQKIATLALFDPEGRLIELYQQQLVEMEQLATAQQGVANVKGVVDGVKQLADVIGTFATNAVTKGLGGAIDGLRQSWHAFILQIISDLAKKYVLTVIGNYIGGPAGGSLLSAAGQVGQNTLAGSVTNYLGGAALNYGAGLSGGGLGVAASGETASAMLDSWLINNGFSSFAGGTAVVIGNAANGLAASLGVADASAAAFGDAVAAAVPVVGWIVAIAGILYAVLGAKPGGPKFGGSTFEGGAVPGTDNGRFFTPNQADADLAKMVLDMGKGFDLVSTMLGGKSHGDLGLNFGLGFDEDPSGSAHSRVSGEIVDKLGNIIYKNLDQEMDDKQVPAAIALELKREFVAGLQNEDLGKYINDLLGKVGDVASLTADQVDAVLAQLRDAATVSQNLAILPLKNLDLNALATFQQAGETIGQTFQRVAGDWIKLSEQFTSGDTKLSNATTALGELYKSLASLGYDVPTTREGWLKVMESLDQGTESGHALYLQMLALAPAFDAVSTATEGAMAEFDALMGKLRPGYSAGLANTDLSSSLSSFAAANSWAAGLSPQQLLEQLRTIQRDDFGKYSLSNQQLIDHILKLDDSINGNTNAVTDSTKAAAASLDFSGYFDNPANRNEGNRYMWDPTYGTGGSSSGGTSSSNTKKSLADFINGLFYDKTLSPLSSMDQFTNARSDYESLLKLAQGGDQGAMDKLQEASQRYLDLARQIYASGGGYNTVFQSVSREVGAIAGVSVDDKFKAAIPDGSKLASQADIQSLELAVRELTTIMAGSQTQPMAVRFVDAKQPLNGILTP